MSLHNLITTITPYEHAALWQVLTDVEVRMEKLRQSARENRQPLNDRMDELNDSIHHAKLWLNAVNEKLFTEWDMLPEGSHLKKAYEDMVWTWSDRDLETMPD